MAVFSIIARIACDNPRSIEDARHDLRIRRYELLLAQLAANEARNRPVEMALDRAIDSIDRRLMILEGRL
jgi:hypothetical protein